MGSIYGSTPSPNGYYTWQLRLDYTIAQNETANTSSIACDLYVYCPNGLSYNLVENEAYYEICGNRVYQPYDFDAVQWYHLGSRTVSGISHNADGSKSYTLSAKWVTENQTDYTPASISLSETVTLPTINRGLVNVNVDGTWRKAVPYVNVSGIWRRAKAWRNVGGTWKIGI